MAQILKPEPPDPHAITRQSVLAGKLAPRMFALYHMCKAKSPLLPESLASFIDEVPPAYTVASPRRRVKWQAAIMRFLPEERYAAFVKEQHPILENQRIEAHAPGVWILASLPPWHKIKRSAWLIAVRRRLGLSLLPLFGLQVGSHMVTCPRVSADGQRCGAQMDELGRHAATCRTGGNLSKRHNRIRDAIMPALRGMADCVEREVIVPELAEINHDTGALKEARLDIVLRRPNLVAYIDFVCTQAIDEHGTPVKVGYSEDGKHRRYKARDENGRRRIEGTVYAAACSTAGKVGEEWKQLSCILTEGVKIPSSYLSLPDLLSTFAVLESAMAILDAYRPGIHGTTHPEVLQSAIPILAPAVELAALEPLRASIPLPSGQVREPEDLANGSLDEKKSPP